MTKASLTPSATAKNREFDVVLLGASGFVGQLTAHYLAHHAPPGTRVALAGRSPHKLATVAAGLPGQAQEWTLITADSHDDVALASLAQRTQVVASTVGPYARHGLPLVNACAAAGTDYTDLTGEVLFVRQSIDRFNAQARRTGARIVHSCGFDSAPSDLGVLLLHERARADGAGDLTDTTLVATMKGTFSGGTIDSVRGHLDEVATNKKSRSLADDPYSLSPDRSSEPVLTEERDLMPVRQDSRLGGWTGPFVMASFNTRVVRRSNAIQQWAYGREFRYRELMGFGSGLRGRVTAYGASAALRGFIAGMSNPLSRPILDWILPEPGSGPHEESRAAGSFRMSLYAATTSGLGYHATVAAQGDPGYTATSVMLGESALALALDELSREGGVLTPATGIGGTLTERLKKANFIIGSISPLARSLR
ncbi:MAG: saccharopine dehydrogenase family protein [Actinomycetota bacterium]